MGAAYFYHLTRSPLEETLAMLLGKARAAGWRVLVRADSDALLDELDAALWVKPEDGFLPHGRGVGTDDPRQPIVLGNIDATGFGCLMSVGGAEVGADEAATLERVCILFDGQDPDAVARARIQWKALTDAGVSAQYWAQDGGRWEKRAAR